MVYLVELDCDRCTSWELKYCYFYVLMNNLDNFVDRPSFAIANCSNNEVNFFGKENQSLKSTDKVGIFKGGDDTDASKKELDEKKDKSKNDWRNMPTCDMDWIIILSCGDQFDLSIEVICKEHQDSASDQMMLARKEMEAVLDVCIKDKGMFLKYICPDFPGIQFSKEEHTKRIKQIMLSSEKEGGKYYNHLNVFNSVSII